MGGGGNDTKMDRSGRGQLALVPLYQHGRGIDELVYRLLSLMMGPQCISFQNGQNKIGSLVKKINCKLGAAMCWNGCNQISLLGVGPECDWYTKKVEKLTLHTRDNGK